LLELTFFLSLGEHFKSLKSKKGSKNSLSPQFNETFTLTAAEHGLWCAHFVRIAIKDALWLGEDSDMGEVLIPLDEISLQASAEAGAYSSHQVRATAKMQADLKGSYSGMQSSDLGCLFVSTKLLVTKKSHTVMTTLPKVILRSQLQEIDPYMTQWACVGVTARDHVQQSNTRGRSNMFNMLTGLDCLSILDNGDGEFEKQHFDAVSVAHQFQRRYIDASRREAIEVRLFEVQRRALLPPHEFNRNNLLYTDAFEFSDYSGSIRAPYSPYEAEIPLVTPPGFVWDGDWAVDMTFPGTKEDGWYSGLDLTLRKRCWVRKGVQQHKKNETIQLTRKSEIYIFENQRRCAFPPYKFGLGNSLPFERLDFSDESGQVSAPYKSLSHAIPPDGYEWDGEWEIDYAHTNTDVEGWSYGREYIDIMARYKAGSSSASAGMLSCCRRRRWKRNIQVSELSDRCVQPPLSKDGELATERMSYTIRTDSDAVETSPRHDESIPSDLHEEAMADDTGAALVSLNEIMADEIERGSVEVHIFENQRRCAFPPYQYGPGHSLPFERLDFSDESGQVSAPYKSLSHAIPPDGYEWDGEWEIDYAHIQTEVDGWSYGADYTAIMREYVNKTNRFSMMLSCCRRRRWKRKVRPTIQRTKSGGHFALGVSVDLATQLAQEYSSKMKINKDQEGGSSSKILESCKEKETLRAPINIPWNQVVSADIVSPTVMAIRVKVHRYFGQDRFGSRMPSEGSMKGSKKGDCFEHDNNADDKSAGKSLFREVELDFYVLNCAAFSILSVIRERMFFSDIRTQLLQLSKTKMITGDIQNPYNLQAWSLNDDECDADDNANEEGLLFVANDLSLGSHVALLMDRMCHQLSQDVDNFRGLEGLFVLEKQHVERLRGRMQVYLAAALELRVQGPSFKVESLQAVLELDTSVAERFLSGEEGDTASVAHSASSLTRFFLDVAETRIRDMCVCGWGRTAASGEHAEEYGLQDALSAIIHHYYANIIALMGTYFGSKEALLSVQVRIESLFVKYKIVQLDLIL
jgi:hypothetical protein